VQTASHSLGEEGAGKENGGEEVGGEENGPGCVTERNGNCQSVSEMQHSLGGHGNAQMV